MIAVFSSVMQEGAAFTVTLHAALMPLRVVAVMVALPTATPRMLPVAASTATTDGSLLA